MANGSLDTRALVEPYRQSGVEDLSSRDLPLDTGSNMPDRAEPLSYHSILGGFA